MNPMLSPFSSSRSRHAVDNVEQVTRRLNAFVKHPTKRVLLLRGAWGVGKTYYWSNVFAPRIMSSQHTMSVSRYAYVSLFGAESISDLEHRIFAEVNPYTLSPTRRGLHWCKKHMLNLANDLPQLQTYARLIRRFGLISIRDTLICIDDIERKGKAMELANLLGYVSVLREHNNCRVVLIMNDENLASDEDRKTLDRYRDKVIDETITFSPDIDYNCRLIFGGKPSHEACLDVFRRLDMNNIRIMQQTAWAVEQFAPYLDELESALQSEVIEHVVLLTCFRHDISYEIDLKDIPVDSIVEHVYHAEADDRSHAAALEGKLRKWNYFPADYDACIVEYLLTGQYDDSVLKTLLAIENTNAQNRAVAIELRTIWSAFNNNFQADDETLRGSIVNFLNRSAASTGERKLRHLFSMLKDVGGEQDLIEKQEEWIKAWIIARLPNASIEDLDSYEKMASDPSVLRRIEERREALNQGMNPSVIVEALIVSDPANPVLAERLGKATVDQFVAAFEQCSADDFLRTLASICKVWRTGSEAERRTLATMTEALLQIAGRNRANKQRVQEIIPWACKEPSEAIASGVRDPGDTREEAAV